MKIEIMKPDRTLPTMKRVAAYARVSSDKDAMHHSLSAQVSYYSTMIQNHREWKYVGVYADEAKTGTKDDRESFQRLLADCRDGKIDLIITKSISRFARNTVTLLETVRELKSLGVDVFFEEQNTHTLSADGELMLTILASYAQEESRSVSENQKWRVRKNFEEGIPWNGAMLGYRYSNGKYIVIPEEAEVVKRIYAYYLSGMGIVAIVKDLNNNSIPTRLGNKWTKTVITKILRNYAYTGNLLLQKTFHENHITKRTKVNRGELPMYHATDTHEAIIDIDTFNAVQKEIELRAIKHKAKAPLKTYPFTSMIVCGNCGKHYRRKVTHADPVWICNTYNTFGKKACASKQIPESTLNKLSADIDLNKLSFIQADNGNKVTFVFKDGSEIVKFWEDKSRSASWNNHMKEQARQKTLERMAG